MQYKNRQQEEKCGFGNQSILSQGIFILMIAVMDNYLEPGEFVRNI